MRYTQPHVLHSCANNVQRKTQVMHKIFPDLIFPLRKIQVTIKLKVVDWGVVVRVNVIKIAILVKKKKYNGFGLCLKH